MTYALKTEPEDFIVEEELGRALTDDGDYLILRVTKRNYNTHDMIERLAQATPYDQDRFGYAGNKDRRAITTQYVSVRHGHAHHFDSLDLKDIDVDIAGWSDAPISFGDHDGNHFTIRVNGLDEADVNPMPRFVNYFDEQRFSEYNHVVGHDLVTGDLEGAVQRLLQDDHHGPVLRRHLDSHPNDYATALRQLPSELTGLFVHAYQSQLWNRSVQRRIDELSSDDDFPLIGFQTRPRSDLEREEIKAVLDEEDISPRDFIIRSIPEISAEGTRRDVYKQINSLDVSRDGSAIVLSFSLGTGSYATMAVKHLVGDVEPTT